jgi:glycosyltransferase 2 family protein
MKVTLPKLLRLAVTLGIIALLVVFARKVDWAASWAAIRGSDPYLIALATIINIISLAFKGVRWWVFIRAITPIRLAPVMRATLAGAGLNNVLVANGGDAARVLFVTRATGSSSAKILATLAVERLFDVAVFVILLAVAAFLLPLPFDASAWRLPAAAGLIAMVALAIYLIRRSEAKPAETATVVVAETVAPSLFERARSYGRRFMSSVSTLSTGPRFAGAMGLSILAWIGQIACYHVSAMAAHFPISLWGTIASFLAVNLGLVIRATPGNVGFFQLMYAVTAVSFGMRRDDAVGVALLIQALQTIPITLLGIGLAPEFVFRKKSPRG